MDGLTHMMWGATDSTVGVKSRWPPLTLLLLDHIRILLLVLLLLLMESSDEMRLLLANPAWL